MPIKVPGKRDRRGRHGAPKRSVVAVLSLTAMVDLFTVLVVFLLQNYNVTGEVIEIPKGVELPEAAAVKELKPANVVIVSELDGVKLNNETVTGWDNIRSQQDWMITELRDAVVKVIEEGEKEKASLASKIKQAVDNVQTEDGQPLEIDDFKKITIQADKGTDFLTVKKVMYTVTEAGIQEINFAVIKSVDEMANNQNAGP